MASWCKARDDDPWALTGVGLVRTQDIDDTNSISSITATNARRIFPLHTIFHVLTLAEIKSCFQKGNFVVVGGLAQLFPNLAKVIWLDFKANKLARGRVGHNCTRRRATSNQQPASKRTPWVNDKYSGE